MVSTERGRRVLQIMIDGCCGTKSFFRCRRWSWCPCGVLNNCWSLRWAPRVGFIRHWTFCRHTCWWFSFFSSSAKRWFCWGSWRIRCWGGCWALRDCEGTLCRLIRWFVSYESNGRRLSWRIRLEPVINNSCKKSDGWKLVRMRNCRKSCLFLDWLTIPSSVQRESFPWKATGIAFNYVDIGIRCISGTRSNSEGIPQISSIGVCNSDVEGDVLTRRY